MANESKSRFLEELTRKFGQIRRLGNSQSLYTIGNEAGRIYVRYSKVHSSDRTFYGLRKDDLRELEGHRSFICFLWNGQTEPLLVPFSDYEEVFQSVSPAPDGQYKTQVYLQDGGTELYVAQAGRFNAEGYFGWRQLDGLRESAGTQERCELTHSQVQTLLGAIGVAKDYGVWVPLNDRPALDWSLARPYGCEPRPPYGFEGAESITEEIDVMWVHRGSGQPTALFEVEHSTPVYSGLLRLNDIHLAVPRLRARFAIVAQDGRRSLYVRQLRRPTFRLSGLHDICTFLDYENVVRWHEGVAGARGR